MGSFSAHIDTQEQFSKCLCKVEGKGKKQKLSSNLLVMSASHLIAFSRQPQTSLKDVTQ
ncbi:mCG1035690 [Mus musculus]|nr:mCG1035690 [Mus musculus]